MALQLRRGTNEQRQLILLAEGEPFYVTDAEALGVAPLWVGDGTTFGGYAVASISNIEELFDVTVTNPLNKQVLQWNTANGRWENFSNVVIPGTAKMNTTLEVDGATTLNNTLDVIGQTTLANTSISGVLNVTGSGSYLYASQLSIADNIITINADKTAGVASEFMGFDFLRGDSATVKFRWNENIDKFEYTTDGTTYHTLANQDLNTTSDVKFNGLTLGASNADNASLLMQTIDGITARLTNDGQFNLFSLQFYDYNRLQFNQTNQWFNTGYLGIGTQAPLSNLHISDLDNSQIRLATQNHDVIVTNDDTLDLFSVYYDGNRLQFDGTDQWFNTGKLGVNTETPEYTLDVNGTIRSTEAIFDSISVAGGGINDTAIGAITPSTGAFTSLTTTGSVVIAGDLTVNGTTTTLNTQELLIEDNIITLNSNVTGTPTLNAGIEIERGDSPNVSIRWDETLDQWQYTDNGVDYYAILSTGYDGNLTINDLTLLGDIYDSNNDLKIQFPESDIVPLQINHRLSFQDTLYLQLPTEAGYLAPMPIIQGRDIDTIDILKNISMGVSGSIRTQSASGGIDTYPAITFTGADQYPFKPDVTIHGDLILESGMTQLSVGSIVPLEGSTTIQLDSDLVRAENDLWVIGDFLSLGGMATNSKFINLNNADSPLFGSAGLNVKKGYTETATVEFVGTENRWQFTNNGARAIVNVSGVDIDGVAGHNTLTLTTTTTDPDQVVFVAQNKTHKLCIEITSGTDIQAMEMMIMHDGTNAYMTQYADISSNGTLATFSVDYVSGLRLLTTPVNASTTIKIAITTILV